MNEVRAATGEWFAVEQKNGLWAIHDGDAEPIHNIRHQPAPAELDLAEQLYRLGIARGVAHGYEERAREIRAALGIKED